MRVDERIATRRAQVRAARRWARLRRTLAVFVLILLASGVVWFEQSEHATVLSIEVVGLSRLEAEIVVIASGVAVGDSALRLRPARIERDVAALALVRSAEVDRERLRHLVVTVEERGPVYVAQHRSGSVLVDRDGVVIARGSDDRLPIIRLRTPPPDPGALVASHAALANAHRVWTGLSGPLRSRVTAMAAPDEDGLEIILRDAPVVRFGRAELLEEKVRAMGAVLDDVAGSEVTLVDVRVPGFPIVRID